MLTPQPMTLKLLLENYRRGTFKFVKVNGEYRFSDATWHGYSHSDMVEDIDGPFADAAGFINLERQGWSMGKQWSESCGIGCGDAEIVELTKLLDPLPYLGANRINAVQGTRL
jgi:hypothetical protein